MAQTLSNEQFDAILSDPNAVMATRVSNKDFDAVVGANKPSMRDYGFYERKWNLPSNILKDIVEVGERSSATSTSPKGAKGEFQLTAANRQAFGVTDPTNFDQSADAAGRLLSEAQSYYRRSYPNASEDNLRRALLAHYNGGVKQGTQAILGQPLSYKETRQYVNRIEAQNKANKPQTLSNTEFDALLQEPVVASKPEPTTRKGWFGEDIPIAEDTANGDSGVVSPDATSFKNAALYTATAGFAGKKPSEKENQKAVIAGQVIGSMPYVLTGSLGAQSLALGARGTVQALNEGEGVKDALVSGAVEGGTNLVLGKAGEAVVKNVVIPAAKWGRKQIGDLIAPTVASKNASLSAAIPNFDAMLSNAAGKASVPEVRKALVQMGVPDNILTEGNIQAFIDARVTRGGKPWETAIGDFIGNMSPDSIPDTYVSGLLKSEAALRELIASKNLVNMPQALKEQFNTAINNNDYVALDNLVKRSPLLSKAVVKAIDDYTRALRSANAAANQAVKTGATPSKESLVGDFVYKDESKTPIVTHVVNTAKNIISSPSVAGAATGYVGSKLVGEDDNAARNALIGAAIGAAGKGGIGNTLVQAKIDTLGGIVRGFAEKSPTAAKVFSQLKPTSIGAQTEYVAYSLRQMEKEINAVKNKFDAGKIDTATGIKLINDILDKNGARWTPPKLMSSNVKVVDSQAKTLLTGNKYNPDQFLAQQWYATNKAGETAIKKYLSGQHSINNIFDVKMPKIIEKVSAPAHALTGQLLSEGVNEEGKRKERVTKMKLTGD